MHVEHFDATFHGQDAACRCNGSDTGMGFLNGGKVLVILRVRVLPAAQAIVTGWAGGDLHHAMVAHKVPTNNKVAGADSVIPSLLYSNFTFQCM